MGTIKDIIHFIRTPTRKGNKEYRPINGAKGKKDQVPWTVIDNRPGETIEQISKRQDKVVYTWKYYFFKPIILLVERFNKKYHPPEETATQKGGWKDLNHNPQNEYLSAVDDAMKKSLEEWIDGYLLLAWSQDPKTRTKEYKEWFKRTNHTYRLLDGARKSSITYALQDTALREYMNIFALNLYKNMNAIMLERERKDPNAKTNDQHLIFASEYTNDVHYLMFYRYIETGSMRVHCQHHPPPVFGTVERQQEVRNMVLQEHATNVQAQQQKDASIVVEPPAAAMDFLSKAVKGDKK